jgi:hypothetical protein
MNHRISLGLAMLAGAAMGAMAVNGLHAQNKAPGAYSYCIIKHGACIWRLELRSTDISAVC